MIIAEELKKTCKPILLLRDLIFLKPHPYYFPSQTDLHTQTLTINESMKRSFSGFIVVKVLKKSGQ